MFVTACTTILGQMYVIDYVSAVIVRPIYVANCFSLMLNVRCDNGNLLNPITLR